MTFPACSQEEALSLWKDPKNQYLPIITSTGFVQGVYFPLDVLNAVSIVIKNRNNSSYFLPAHAIK